MWFVLIWGAYRRAIVHVVLCGRRELSLASVSLVASMRDCSADLEKPQEIAISLLVCVVREAKKRNQWSPKRREREFQILVLEKKESSTL